MRNCFGNLAKFIVVVTNLIVFIVGCVSTGFGTYYLVTIDPIETDVSSEDSKDVVNYYNTSDNQRQHLIVATSELQNVQWSALWARILQQLYIRWQHVQHK